MFILCVHDAFMALGFQKGLFVLFKKKNLPLFSYKSNFKGNINSASKSYN